MAHMAQQGWAGWSLCYRITIDEQLKVELSSYNRSDLQKKHPNITQLFFIGDIHSTNVEGYDDCAFIDTNDDSEHGQSGLISFNE